MSLADSVPAFTGPPTSPTSRDGWVVAIVFRGEAPATATGEPGGRYLVNAIEGALRSRRLEGTIHVEVSHVVVLLQCHRVSTSKSSAMQFVEDVRSLAALSGRCGAVSVGLLGAAVPADDSDHAVAQARLALVIGIASFGSSSITMYEELRALPALLDGARLPNGELQAVMDRYVRPLADYQATTGLPLLETLLTLFDQNGNVSRTARVLGLNRQSLLYRLRKVERIVTLDLGDALDRFSMELAVRAWAVLSSVTSSAQPATDPARADLDAPARARGSAGEPLRKAAG